MCMFITEYQFCMYGIVIVSKDANSILQVNPFCPQNIWSALGISNYTWNNGVSLVEQENRWYVYDVYSKSWHSQAQSWFCIFFICWHGLNNQNCVLVPLPSISFFICKYVAMQSFILLILLIFTTLMDMLITTYGHSDSSWYLLELVIFILLLFCSSFLVITFAMKQYGVCEMETACAFFSMVVRLTHTKLLYLSSVPFFLCKYAAMLSLILLILLTFTALMDLSPMVALIRAGSSLS